MTGTLDPQPTVGDLVRIARLGKNWTQDYLAEVVGMSQRWVSSLERNDVVLPRTAVLRRLSTSLEIPLPDLFLAGRVAQTRSEAEQIAAGDPSDDPEEPLLNVVFQDLRKLNADDLSHVSAIVRRLTAGQK